MTSIRDQAVELEQADKRYRPFTDKLQQFAKAHYDDDAILALIEQWRELVQ